MIPEHLLLCLSSSLCHHILYLFFQCSAHHQALHSFPTRRSSDLTSSMWLAIDAVKKGEAGVAISAGNTGALMADRKSTRLNSSHVSISYAVFCLKKKKKKK